jgi:uncharacterized protein (TIGR04141 family)
MTRAIPVRTLTIFLVKEQVDETEIIDPEEAAQCSETPVSLESRQVGILFAKQTPTTPPGWLKFFAESGAEMPRLRRASVAAAFVTRTAGRFFVLVFGQGRHLIKSGACEERFGLRVTLNSVDPKSLRAVDVSTLEANPFHGTRQASREATLGEFGINLDQDILRAVTGRPTDEQLGRRMTGIDSLSVRVRVNLSTLNSLLKRYLRKSEDDSYRANFRWVDHVAEVRDDELDARLASTLVDLINGNRHANVWAAIPERIEWEKFDSFRFGAKRDAASADDITLDRMIDYFGGEAVSMASLQTAFVYCYAEENPHPLHRWSFFRCLTADLDLEGEKYLLNAGKWYRVSREFVAEVDQELASLLDGTSTSTMPDWGDEYEDAYNARIASGSGGRLALMDRVMVQHDGMPSPIEFCDLFSDDHRLIHVKRYGQSSVLSHLFLQGLVSAESLLSDARFRRAVNEKLPPTHQLSDPNARPLPAQYQIVFAIGTSEMGVLRLPFFSRVTLRNVARTLMHSFGYQVSVSKIRIDKLTALSGIRE